MELLGGQNFFPRSQMSESFDLPAGCCILKNKIGMTLRILSLLQVQNLALDLSEMFCNPDVLISNDIEIIW